MPNYHKVRQIENYPTANGDVPTSPIVISSCGVLSPDDPSLAEAAAVDGDPYEDYPDDEDRDVQNPEIALDIAKTVREVGNKLFKEGKTDLALQKYQSERISLKPCLDPCFNYLSESIRYLDVHPVMPDNSPPELKESFDALLAPLLLNSALAAIRSDTSTVNANTAVKNTTRALERLELNTSDKGAVLLGPLNLVD